MKGLNISILDVQEPFSNKVNPRQCWQLNSQYRYNSAKLNQSKSALIIYFDPWCEHCNQQAEWIAARPDAFKNVQILFVTFEPEKTPIQEFKNKYFSAAGWSNVVFLQDLDFQFETYFGYTDDPLYIYCYKPGGGKGKYFGEEQRAEVLINFL